VYPVLHDVPLVPLGELHKRYPTVAALLREGVWNKEAEAEFLRVAGT
jgi:L-sorbose 1-phosphate reductase